MTTPWSEVFHLVYLQLFYTPPTPTGNLSGQTYIVTGANTGLGFEAAKHLVRLQASRVILACRTASKGEAAAQKIEAATGRRGVVQVWSLDLSSYESVKAFAARATSELDRLDCLLESAGISETKQLYKVEDEEATIRTNVTSTFLLALLLLPKLQETAQRFNITPRLTIVTSEVHYMTKLADEKGQPSIFEALAEENSKSWNNTMARYWVSKLLEVLYVRRLAPAMSASNKKPEVILNMLNPGWCWSDLIREKPLFVKILMKLVARTTEVGSRTLVYGALAGEESHGKYMSDGKVTTPSKWVSSPEGEETATRIYNELNAKLEKISPGITSNI